MAHTVSDYWFNITRNRASILLGEDHRGAWSNTPSALAALMGVVDAHDNQSRKVGAPITVWHEGEGTAAISKSFHAFVNWFKGEYSNPVRIAQWEPSESTIRYTRDEKLVIALFAGDEGQTEKHLGLGGIYLDRLLAEKGWRFSPNEAYTADDILKTAARGKHGRRYTELLRAPITRQGLVEWFTLREEAFEDTTSPLYAVMTAPQHRREDYLGKLAYSRSGAYLVGESHIATMRTRRILK